MQGRTISPHESAFPEVWAVIVWLASYPRSGNTYLRFVLHRTYGRQSMSWDPAETQRIHEEGTRVRPFAAPLDRPLEDLQSSPSISFVKTHDLSPPGPGPALYIVRDGRDALVSYAWYVLRFVRKLPEAELDPERFYEMLATLIENTGSPYGSWSGNVAAWTRRPATALLRFEELIRKPRIVGDALGRLGLDLPQLPGGRPPSFRELHALRPDFFRRGQVDAWRDEFPAELLPRFWQVHGAAMQGLGYGPPPIP